MSTARLVTQTGLTVSEAARRLEEHGPNELPHEPALGLAARVGQQLRDPMILLLCAALVLVVAVGDHADAVIIAAVIVLNTTIGVVQDVRAQHAVDALSRMAAPRAHVWRDGLLAEISAADLVPATGSGWRPATSSRRTSSSRRPRRWRWTSPP